MSRHAAIANPRPTTVLELLEVLGADLAEVMRELSAARNTPR